MSDYGDFCREMAEHRKEVRAKNWAENQRFIEEMFQLGASYEVLPGGFRFHFPKGLRIDFWPSSGKWTHVGTNQYNLGPRKMVEYVKGQIDGTNRGQQDRGDYDRPDDTRSTRRQDADSPSGECGFHVRGRTTIPTNWPPSERTDSDPGQGSSTGRSRESDPDAPPWEL